MANPKMYPEYFHIFYNKALFNYLLFFSKVFLIIDKVFMTHAEVHIQVIS